MNILKGFWTSACWLIAVEIVSNQHQPNQTKLKQTIPTSNEKWRCDAK